MSEPDVFETRFATAYRRYLDEAPTEVDAAAVVRTVAAAHPRARTGARPWALGAARALAWLVLLALLLAALGAAALFVGSQRSALGFACPPGSTPNTPGPADQARPPGFSGMAFDRGAGRLVTVWGTETWTFDICTNTWHQMHPSREPSTSLVGPLIYDVDSAVTIGVVGPDENPGNMWAYDSGANTWTEYGPFAPFLHSSRESLRSYDPVSGRVMALGDDGDENTLGLELWGYEVESDTWTPTQVEPLVIGPHYEFFAYDASVNRLVAYARTWGPANANGDWLFETRTWLFDLRTGRWSGTEAVTPPYFNAGMWGLAPGIAYDEAAKRTVMIGQGYSAAYDATADHWETLYETPSDEPGTCGTGPECRQAQDIIYDAVNKRLVVYGGSVYASAELGWVDPDDILAYDTRTGAWTDLLVAP
ncbi:MAG: hypothetical protein A2X23_13485 [Chloroflexi bacterium GWC2_73_18]|nr:MAG: hypothetical protein A2X23_13485 [Chloroflexi bacterium GWC2_73_18]